MFSAGMNYIFKYYLHELKVSIMLKYVVHNALCFKGSNFSTCRESLKWEFYNA